MSTEQYNTTERSSQDKHPEWGESLGGHGSHRHRHHHYHQQQQQQQQQQEQYQQHAYFRQQTAQRVYSNQHLAGGSLEDATFQSAGPETAFGISSDRASDSGCTMQSSYHADAGQVVVPALHRDPRQPGGLVSVSHVRFGMPSLDTSSNHRKNTVNAAARLHQARGGEEHNTYPGKAGATPVLSMSTSAKVSAAPRRMRNSSVSPLTVRPTGTKDRHSKVRTAKGLRDRRVRLSAPTAIQFFDVQDRLGYDQPSKAVDWLIKKARAAIDELAPVEGVIVGDETADMPVVHEQKLSKDHHLISSFVKVKDEEQSPATVIAGGGARAESRAKARERARERAKDKNVAPAAGGLAVCTTSKDTGTSTSPAVTAPPAQSFALPPNDHLLPEFFMLTGQFQQQLDDLNRPSDLSSMITPPAPTPPLPPHLLQFPSPFFSTNSAVQSFILPGEGPPPLQYSTPSITYNTTTATITATANNNQSSHINNNTPNSPRGTLQSIFSSPVISSMQAHLPPPIQIMGGQLQRLSYGATTQSSVVRESGHSSNTMYRPSSVELGSSPDSPQHSRIPIRIRGMEQMGSHVEETRTTPSSLRADFQ